MTLAKKVLEAHGIVEAYSIVFDGKSETIKDLQKAFEKEGHKLEVDRNNKLTTVTPDGEELTILKDDEIFFKNGRISLKGPAFSGGKVITLKEALAKKSYPEGKGPKTPWGPAQYSTQIMKGVSWVTTAGHGGLMVAETVAKKELSDKAREQGLKFGSYYCFEEDSAWAVVAYEHIDWFDGLFSKPITKEYAKEQIDRWMPKYFDGKEFKEAPTMKTLKEGDKVILKTRDGIQTYVVMENKGSSMIVSVFSQKYGGTIGRYKLGKSAYNSMVIKVMRGEEVLFDKGVSEAIEAPSEIDIRNLEYALDKVTRKPVSAQAMLYKSMLKTLISVVQETPAGTRILKGFSVDALRIVKDGIDVDTLTSADDVYEAYQPTASDKIRDIKNSIKDLCNMVNLYSEKLGLGRKVRVEDFLENVEKLEKILSKKEALAISNEASAVPMRFEIAMEKLSKKPVAVKIETMEYALKNLMDRVSEKTGNTSTVKEFASHFLSVVQHGFKDIVDEPETEFDDDTMSDDIGESKRQGAVEDGDLSDSENQFSIDFNDEIESLAKDVEKFIAPKIKSIAKKLNVSDRSQLRFHYDGVKQFDYGVTLALGRELAETDDTRTVIPIIEESHKAPVKGLARRVIEEYAVETDEAKMTAKKAEKIVNDLYSKHGHGVQIDIFDLSKVSDPAEKHLMAGGSEEEAEKMVVDAIAKYRKN